MFIKVSKWLLIAAVLIQLIPYGRNHTNPPATGDMPPWYYLPMHPAAKLTASEKAALRDGAEKSLGPQTAEGH